jgi:hypothetical protein
MVSYRMLAAGTIVLLAGCTPPPPSPGVMALPAQGKDLATFQHEDTECQQYAATQAGIALPLQTLPIQAATPGQPQPPPPPPPPPSEANRQLFEISYSQCMVSHGDTIRAVPVATSYAPYYPYPAYPYPVMYGAGYPYPYPFFYGGYYGGWGGGWHGGWGHGDFHGGSYHH